MRHFLKSTCLRSVLNARLGYEGGDYPHAVGEDDGANQRNKDGEHALHVGGRHHVPVPLQMRARMHKLSREHAPSMIIKEGIYCGCRSSCC